MTQEGSERSVWRPRGFPGVLRFSGERPCNFRRGPSGELIRPMGAFLGGPGSANGGQGFKFDGETELILTISLFAPIGFWKVPMGVPRACSAAQAAPRKVPGARAGLKRNLREAKNERSLFFGGPRGAQIGTSFEKVRYFKSSNITGEKSKQRKIIIFLRCAPNKTY